MKRSLWRVWLVLFSTGWLLPFTYALLAAFDFLWRWVWPMAAFRDGRNVSPFHPFQWSPELLCIGAVWLGIVIAYWVLRATKMPTKGS